jgi:hypothetical protein
MVSKFGLAPFWCNKTETETQSGAPQLQDFKIQMGLVFGPAHL